MSIAPYSRGDLIEVHHTCDVAGSSASAPMKARQVEHRVSLRVEAVRRLNLPDRFRVSTHRCDGSLLDVTVGADGRDFGGFAEPVSTVLA